MPQHPFKRIAPILLAVAVAEAADIVSLSTATSSFGIDGTGSLSAITGNGHNYLAPGQPAPVLQVRIEGQDLAPESATWDAASTRLTLRYQGGAAQAVVKITAKPSHVVMELVAASPLDRIDAVRWGPYPTTINRVVGELVGVVRDTEFAIGIQSLNSKTQDGEPCGDGFIDQSYRALDAVQHDGILKIISTPVQYRGGAAKATTFGSILQMHAWEHERSDAFAQANATSGARSYAPIQPVKYPGWTVVGTKIALFACPEPQALATLGDIELTEGLPHPLIDGAWAKSSPQNGPIQYFCFEFDETNLDEFIGVADKAGIKWIYHNSPWDTWGHFPPKPGMFPGGMASLGACVTKIHDAGLRFGAHTLSLFITDDDAYATGGDPRLASAQDLTLAKAIAPDDTVIELAEKPLFGGNQNVIIDREIIAFTGVIDTPPWKLTGCLRGSHGTARAAHPAGARVGKLASMRYGKDVFHGNLELGTEIMANCAKICNEAKIDHWCFDGFESYSALGVGGAGGGIFLDAWNAGLSPEKRNRMMIEASCMSNYGWHSTFSANWGEPWYDTFRKSMLAYRLEMVRFHARNYLPPMLGQYFIHPDGETPEDIEWLMALATGYNAGFSLTFGRGSSSYVTGEATSETARIRPPNLDALMAIIRVWREAHAAGAFTAAIREQLQDETREFHLASAGAGQWDLYPRTNGTLGAPTRLVAAGTP
ncbi:MAG: hypothetical protein J0M04_06645 [Verrucomicrobia bacterium]|nr:hypothetical protein [Verrucomicrobiota bacterium]